MVTKYEKANRSKLLIAVMAMVMIFAGAAVVLSDSETMAAGDETSETGIGQDIVALQDPVTIVGKAYLTGSDSVVIPEGKTLIIKSTGSLDLRGVDLVIEGELVIEGRGFISNTVSDSGSIELMKGGSIQNEGTIGKVTDKAKFYAVDVSAGSVDEKYEGAGKVSLENVTGASFSLVKETTKDGTTYTLAVSGNITKSNGSVSKDTKQITFEGAVINGPMTTTPDVTISGAVKIVKGGSLVANGEMAADVTLQNNTTITVKGAFTGKIIAQAQEDIEAGKDYDADIGEDATFEADDSKNKITGFTVSVSRVQYSEDGKVFFDQRAYLSGSVAFSDKDNKDSGTLKLEGLIFVKSDETVNIANDIALSQGNSEYTLIVDGMVKNVSKEVSFVGAYYEITPEDAVDPIGYITSFDSAMSIIADVDYETITLAGLEGYETTVGGTYTIDDKQSVEYKTSAPLLIIAEGGKITVNNGASLDDDTILNIEGMIVVMDGGMCTIEDDSKYDVMSTNDDGDVTYAGLQVVLNNAKPGDKITVTGTDVEASTLTVPNGVTLEIVTGLTVNKSVTVAEGGKLILKDGAELSIGNGEKPTPGVLTVNGEMDVTDGTLTMLGGSEGVESTITSTGSFIHESSTGFGSDYVMNGAIYEDADSNKVLTTVSKAIAGAIEAETSVTVVGVVNDKTDVVLGGVALAIDTDAKVTLGVIDIKDSSLTSNGELTATIKGQYGEDGSASDAVVEVTKAKFGMTQSVSAVNPQNIDMWTFALGEVTAGSVNVAQGTVVIEDMAGGEKDTFTIASGAKASIESNVSIEDYSKVVVDGELYVSKTGELTMTVDVIVNGTIVVDGKMGVTDISVIGTLKVTESDDFVGEMTVDGELSVGEASKTIGSTGTVEGVVKFGTSGYALAYPGASVSKTNFGKEENVNSTEFYINGGLYVTAYTTNDNVVAIGNGGFMAGVKITGYKYETINDPTKWYSDADLEKPLVASGATAFNIGDVEAAYIELAPANAFVQYSVGSQISLWVDGVKVNSGDKVELSVGEHTVTATVNPGCSGDVTIMFNGQTITDGKFVITPDMNKTTSKDNPVVLSATGNIVIDGGSTGGDSGMGLVEILLIVLVVMVVILAIVVILRMMRS